MGIRRRNRFDPGTLGSPEEIQTPRLGEAIKFLRENANLKQHQVADKSEIHLTEISRMENGWGNPTYETMQRLAKGLGIPCSHIFIMEEILAGRVKAE